MLINLFRKSNPLFIKRTLTRKNYSIWQDLIKLTDDFSWIKNNYISSKIIKPEYFIEEIKSNLFEINFNPQNLKRFEYDLKRQLKLKNALIKKIKPTSKINFLLKLLDFVAYIQDLRKSVWIKHIYHFDFLFKEISRRKGIKIIELKYLSPREIRKLLYNNTGVGVLKKIANQRRKSFLISLAGKKKIISSKSSIVKQYLDWMTKINLRPSVIQGTAACIGPKLKGLARVCLSVRDLVRFKKGEILVTTNTTPEYITVMKKAKAILTEKGGLTSHAAIVSRELKVPCIVGLANICQIFKDGDLVEVDANKGIVKKL